MDKNKYLSILDLKEGATQEEIKKAYKKMAIKYHPDKQNDKSTEEKAIAESKFKEVAEAYDILMNPEKFNNLNNQSFRRTHIDPNELFNQFFNMNIGGGANPFSSRMNININGMNLNNSSNCVMRSSSISFINGQKIEKITETINGVTSVKTIVSGQPNNSSQHIRINFN
jgi:DnaJ-class molecular chaperone